MFIEILDKLVSVFSVVSLFLVARSYKWWAVYTVASIGFVYLMAYKHLYGMMVTGICFVCIGINNFRVGYIKQKEK